MSNQDDKNSRLTLLNETITLYLTSMDIVLPDLMTKETTAILPL
jgi:hypothetical protein